MSGLILPNEWTRQPQTPVGIDWGNPITRGLAGLFDLVNGRDLIDSSPPTTKTTSNSIVNAGRIATFSNSVQIYSHKPRYAVTGALTIFTPIMVTSLTNYSGIISKSSNYYTFPFELRLGASATTSEIDFQRGNGTASAFKGSGSLISANAGVVQKLAVRCISGDLNTAPDVFVNNVKTTLARNGYNTVTGSAGDNGSVLRVGNRFDSVTYLTGGMQYLGLWNRALSDAEILSLSDNPWQIFQPLQRRIWVAGAGGLTLIPSLYVDSDTFYSPTVSPGAVTLSHSLFADADTFYAATVTPGAIALSPSLIVDADTFYAATVMPGGVNLAPALLSSTNTFYSPTVSAGSVNISPSLFNDADTFYIPTVSLDGSPQTLTPGLFVDSDTFYSATVAAGGVTLNPSLFVDADTFYIPTVSLDGAPQNLTPSLYVDSDTFYSPVVSSSGSQDLLPSLFVDADIFYPFSMVNGGFAKRGEYENDQSARRTHIQESTRSNIQTSRRR